MISQQQHMYWLYVRSTVNFLTLKLLLLLPLILTLRLDKSSSSEASFVLFTVKPIPPPTAWTSGGKMSRMECGGVAVVAVVVVEVLVA